MANRRFTLAVIAGCGFLLNACTTAPVYPLQTPIQVAKNFGYFDQPIDDMHLVISYVTPQQAGYGFRFDQSPAEAQAKTLALDMALLHAGEVARSRGYPGFSVTDRHTNVDAVNVASYWDDPFWYGGPGFHHWHWGGPWGPNLYEPPQSSLQVEAKLTIAFTRAPKGDDYRTDEIINRLRAAYPGAEAPFTGPVAPAMTPPPLAKPTI